MIRNPKGDKRMFNLVTDLGMLRSLIERIGNVVMVLIDPVSAYMGHGNVDTFRTSEVRAVLGPLVDLATELKIAFIGIMHFNKKMDVTNALLRISDSLAFGAAARHVYGVVADTENDRKLFVRAKNNLAEKSKDQTLAYSFKARMVAVDPDTGKEIWAPRIIWDDKYVEITAVQAMQAVVDNKSPAQLDRAKQFLRELLGQGPVKADEGKEAAEQHDITKATLKRAREDLVEARKETRLDGEWYWRLKDGGHNWPWEARG
jgi:hypothetical protein